MSFSSFGLPLTIAGGAGLVALLYLLQRLSARRRVIHLPAAGLWIQAMREAPVRMLGARFRYWFAFLLVVVIALLLWGAAARPQLPLTGSDGVDLFYLDNSALLTSSPELARAKRALLADVQATVPRGREVFLGDAVGTRLLNPGEDAALLSRRLADVGAVAQPSRFAGWLARAVARDAGKTAVTVHYYGAWPAVHGAAAQATAKGVQLRYGYLAQPVPGNRGIVALGATPAASGLWRNADVLVAVAAASGNVPTANDLRWTLDGKGYTPASVEPLGDGRYRIRDVVAAGGILGAALTRGDGFVADDSARFQLPDRRPLRVALLDGTPQAIAAVVKADDSLVLVPQGQAQVVVGNTVAVGRSGLPALVVADLAQQPQAFAFAGPGEVGRGDLAGRLDELGLAQIDASALADALHRPIGVDVQDATRRRVGIWAALFAPASPFATSATMPVFVAQSLHWLGDADGWQPFAKAGAIPPDQSQLYGLTTRGSDDPLTARADRVVSLTDRATTLAAADGTAHPPIAGAGGVLPPDFLFVLLLVAAGVLLGAEWWLFQRGVMP